MVIRVLCSERRQRDRHDRERATPGFLNAIDSNPCLSSPLPPARSRWRYRHHARATPEWSLATDVNGIPMAWVCAAANQNAEDAVALPDFAASRGEVSHAMRPISGTTRTITTPAQRTRRDFGSNRSSPSADRTALDDRWEVRVRALNGDDP